MIDKFDFTNAETSVVYSFNNDIAGMTDLDISVTQRADLSRTKMQQHGIWPTFTYRGEMEIHVEGDLIAADSADYVTKRLALAAALFGDPTLLTPTVRKNGSLDILMTGMTEDIGCDVIIDAFSAPQVGGYASYSKYLVTFKSPDPWFVGLTSGTKYYWS
jgi:hypothetical protein